MPIKINPEFQINTYIDSNQGDSSVVSLTNGEFVVIWLSDIQDGSFSGIYGQRYNTNGDRIGQEFQINTYTDNYQTSPSIAALTDGGFIVVWDSNLRDGSLYGIASQRYDANGNRVGEEFIVNTHTDDDEINPIVTSLTNGGFVAVWYSLAGIERDLSIRGQIYDINNNRVGQEFLIAPMGSIAITSLADGGFVVVGYTTARVTYRVFHNIEGRRFDANGNWVGSFIVNNNDPAYTTVGQPAITSLTDGGYVVAWISDNQISRDFNVYGQRYNANGDRAGEKFLINTYITGLQSDPSITSLTDGGFIVTWTSEGQDGSDSGIYGQQYDANGNRVGSQFRINSFTNNAQSDPAVASLTDGEFVVTWSSLEQDRSGAGVYGQIFGQGNVLPLAIGIFEVKKLARSGFISDFSFTPIEINGLPLGSLYDETYYLTQNPDVAAAVNSGVFSNGYDHFVNFGGIEGRNPSLLYNETFYLFENPDVAAAVAMGIIESGSIHYALYGQQEGRSPSEFFDEQAYRLQNPDVDDAITNGGFRSGFEHYLKYGKDEGRLSNNFLYNEVYYLSQNPDVAAAVDAGIFEDGFAHYISYGQTERRNPSSLFNENQYLAQNPDVADAVSSGLLTSGFEHYVLYGRAEN